jgi:sugar lactone lactonase YvrE
VFADLGDALPDGLAVDAEGGVWVAFASGGTVQRLLPDGSLGEAVEVPVRMVTSCAFGGPDLEDLYVVTGSASSSGRDAAIYRTQVGVTGCPVAPCRL